MISCLAVVHLRMRLYRPLLLPIWILLHKVWEEGFEPSASCSQSTRATRLRYTQLFVLIDCGEDADNENGDNHQK